MKLLFITHETSRIGAPMVLLHFLQWLKNNKKNVIADLITLKKGGLDDDFKAVCHSYFDFSQLNKPLKRTLKQ